MEETLQIAVLFLVFLLLSASFIALIVSYSHDDNSKPTCTAKEDACEEKVQSSPEVTFETSDYSSEEGSDFPSEEGTGQTVTSDHIKHFNKI